MNASTYRYKESVVEVSRIHEGRAGVDDFRCLVRGYGHNNPAPRKEYFIAAETNAKASRIAFRRYENEFLREY